MLLIFISRLPFISAGYGLDGDSWSVAITAKLLHEHGIYIPSRLPGYPVHEMLCSLLSSFGYAGLNMVSVIFSTLAVLCFALILRTLRFKYVFLAATAFAFVPAFFIHSTTAIDYNISLAFILAAMYFMLKERLVVAGLLTGLAIGSRITAGAMLIPFLIMLIQNESGKKNSFNIFKLAATALATAVICYIPLLEKYGWSFFTYYNVPYPSIPKVLYKFSIEVWGVLGVAGIIVSTILFFLPAKYTARKFLFPRSVNERFVIAWLVAIDLYIIAFLKLPMEAGYLMPVVPFVIMIYGKYLYNRAFIFFCLMIIASSLFCTISPAERYDAASPSFLSAGFSAGGEKLIFDILQGPVCSYESRRENGVQFVDKLLASTDTISSQSVIVCGRWYNQMIVQGGDTSKLKVTLRDYLSESEAVYFYAKGYNIYYLPKQDFYNKLMRNIDLDIYKAEPYLKEL